MLCLTEKYREYFQKYYFVFGYFIQEWIRMNIENDYHFVSTRDSKRCYLAAARIGSFVFKEVLHPDQFCDCFRIFLKKLQHIGDKWDMFLKGNILRNLTSALEFHWLKWLLIYGSKHGKYWFSHIVYNDFTTMVST